MRREPKVYLNDILEALQKIKNYTEGLNFNKFSEDSRTQDATIRFNLLNLVKQLVTSE